MINHFVYFLLVIFSLLHDDFLCFDIGVSKLRDLLEVVEVVDEAGVAEVLPVRPAIELYTLTWMFFTVEHLHVFYKFPDSLILPIIPKSDCLTYLTAILIVEILLIIHLRVRLL